MGKSGFVESCSKVAWGARASAGQALRSLARLRPGKAASKASAAAASGARKALAAVRAAPRLWGLVLVLWVCSAALAARSVSDLLPQSRSFDPDSWGKVAALLERRPEGVGEGRSLLEGAVLDGSGRVWLDLDSWDSERRNLWSLVSGATKRSSEMFSEEWAKVRKLPPLPVAALPLPGDAPAAWKEFEEASQEALELGKRREAVVAEAARAGGAHLRWAVELREAVSELEDRSSAESPGWSDSVLSLAGRSDSAAGRTKGAGSRIGKAAAAAFALSFFAMSFAMSLSFFAVLFGDAAAHWLSAKGEEAREEARILAERRRIERSADSAAEAPARPSL